MVLDPNAEFKDAPEPKDTEVVVEPVVVKPVPEVAEGASKAELTALKTELDSKLKEIGDLKSKTAILDQLKEVFAGKTEDPRDAFVRKEIRRLVPELDDVDKIKQLLPAIMEALGGSADTMVAEKTESALDYMKGLMKDVGLDSADKDSIGYMEEVLAKEIKANPELLGLWQRGNIKGAVSKAFEKAQSKLFAPIRARAKRGAVSTINESPKASPRGGPGTSTGEGADKGKLNFKDTSRDNVKKIHDAAFERLQELTEG